MGSGGCQGCWVWSKHVRPRLSGAGGLLEAPSLARAGKAGCLGKAERLSSALCLGFFLQISLPNALIPTLPVCVCFFLQPSPFLSQALNFFLRCFPLPVSPLSLIHI